MKHLITMLVVLISYTAFAQDTLHLVPPAVWVKADIPGNDTTYWKDCSGNNHSFYPAGGQQLPAKGQLNFNPCYNLGGSEAPLWTEYNFTNKSRITMVTVYQADDTLNELGIWSAHKGKNWPISLTTHQLFGDRFHIKYADTNITNPVVNTMASAWTKMVNDTCTHDTIYIGGSDSLRFKGKLAECLVYNDFILAKDLQRVQSYLCLKYGVTLEDVDYMDSRKNIIWNKTLNVNYSNAIAGIGKDTIFGLDQKQSYSTSSTDIVTIAAGLLAPSNILNSSNLIQGDFIIWGNNEGSLTAVSTDTSEMIKVLNRVWMVEISGSSARNISTMLKFDISAIDYDSSIIWLVIDTLGEGTLSLPNLRYVQPDSVSQGYAYFSNVTWDSDHNRRDLFTLVFDKTPLATANQPVSASSTSLPDTDNPDDPTYPPNPSYPQISLSLGNGLHDKSNTATLNSLNPPSLSILTTGKEMVNYLLFPNPTDGKFTLNVAFPKECSVTIRILDIQWNLVHQIKGSGKTVYNFIGYVPTSGAYFIDVQHDQQRRVFKLIVR